MNRPKDITAHCPSCGETKALIALYSVQRIPTQSAILLDTAEDAAGFPTGDMDLRCCPSCGLVFNASFQEHLVDYSRGYEVSQAFSPTFLAFARRLSADWIDRFDLKGKNIVEVGCGSGDFLDLFCDLAAAHGTGFDIASPAGKRSTNVTLTGKNLTEADIPLDADFVICRHTLEHVGSISDFLGLLAKAAAQSNAPVAIEVPDIERILKEGAFWDIYYEHSAYFSQASLVRALRQAGFRELDIRRDYGDQYLVAEAVLGKATSPPPKDTTLAIMESFARDVRHQIAAWRDRFAGWEAEGKCVALWGSGSKAVGFLTTVGATSAVKCVVDVNPARHGHFMPGLTMPIVSPDMLESKNIDVVVVMNPIYLDEIKADTETRNLSPEFASITDFREVMPA